MKKLSILCIVLAIPTLVISMDDPSDWQKPTRPSLPGPNRPSNRLQYINSATAPHNPAQPILNAPTADDVTTPLRPSMPGSSRPSRPRPQGIYGATPLLDTQTVAPTATATLPAIQPPAVITAPVINTPTPAQPQVTNPMYVINTGTTPAAATADPTFTQAMTAKEQDRLGKIEKDLNKIEDVLKEMGIDLGAAAVSAAFLDPIGAAFSASSSVINIPKLAYYYGNMQKHIFYLSSSKTSPEAKARLARLTPRLQTVSRVIAKGPESLQKLIKKISKEKTKEAK